jgi:hypothetical protein
MIYILIIALVLAIALIVVGELHLHGIFIDDTPDYGSQFRIVELKNGLYEVQQFRCKWDGLSSLKEWTRPEDDGMNTFHTLDEARVYKARLVEKQTEEDGFNIKSVVE